MTEFFSEADHQLGCAIMAEFIDAVAREDMSFTNGLPQVEREALAAAVASFKVWLRLRGALLGAAAHVECEPPSTDESVN